MIPTTNITKIAGLNLGARNRAIPGFLSMDIDAHEGVDVVGDCSNLSQFEADSIGAIYASHLLEHFEHHRTLAVLKEWFRVLEPGGKLYVAVPDFQRALELYGSTGLDDWIVRLLMGDQAYKTAYHYSLFDEERLTHQLKQAGFADAFRVEEFPIGDDNDCSNLVSNLDGESVSLNMIAVKGSPPEAM